MKICTKCKIEKPRNDFSKSKSKKDGLQFHCNECLRAYRSANKLRISERDIARRIEKPGEAAAYRRAWMAAHPEKASQYQRAYYLVSRDAVMALKKKWEMANPEKVSAHNRNRRALKRNAHGRHSASNVDEIFILQGGLCANCKSTLVRSGDGKFHVDHIVPLSRGGSNDRYNLQCLCPSCNLRKHAKDPISWAKENGRLI